MTYLIKSKIFHTEMFYCENVFCHKCLFCGYHINSTFFVARLIWYYLMELRVRMLLTQIRSYCGLRKYYDYKFISLFISHVRCNHFIPDHHNGFMNSRSTISKLAVFSRFLYENLDYRGLIDALYIYFSKTFSTFNHKILLKNCL